MLHSIQKELKQIVDYGLDRSLRIAVTGLSRSGKTAFITSLINQLLNIHSQENNHLPLFNAVREGKIIGVKREAQLDLSVPRFDYEGNMAKLAENPPHFPVSTRGLSETRLAIRYRPQGLSSYLKSTATLYLDIFDYPGEWLLDLPLLALDFRQWSQQSLHFFNSSRQKLAEDWQQQIATLDLTAPADENLLADIAEKYTDYLFACKQQGLHLIQPGRFVLPGEFADTPALQFFPLLNLSEEQWHYLQKNAVANSYFAVLNQRYEFYRHKIVKKFYRDYFARFDRQVILADCLTPLNHSYQAFKDMQDALTQLFQNFHYGKRHLLQRLFSPRIDKLMFIATKADHITSDQLPNLVSLMRHLVQQGGQYAQFENVETECTAISAIRATKQVNVTQNGQQFKAIQGIRSSDWQKVTVFPGSVPAKIPSPDFWQNHRFEFDQFEPLQVEQGEKIPHLRMDSVLQFLLGDKIN